MAKTVIGQVFKLNRLCCQSRSSIWRSLSKQNYSIMNTDDDGDPIPEGMKTKVTVLSQEDDSWINVTAYSKMGFVLNNGVRVMGPCILFPKSTFHWNVSGVEDIHEKSLSLFPLLVPKIDLLILGIGEPKNMSLVDPNIVLFLRSHGISVEVLPTEQALPTYNFLNSERRHTAGAFIPPRYIRDDMFEEYLDDNIPSVDYTDPANLLEGDLIPGVTKEERNVKTHWFKPNKKDKD